jgi:hypothetical protein
MIAARIARAVRLCMSPPALLLLVLAARPLAAQDYPRLVVEGRAGAAVPILAFRTGPDTGGKIAVAPTFGLHFVYRAPSGWGPYIGFSQHRFDCGADGCPNAEYVATTWDTGMQRTLGASGPVWMRLGVLFGRLEREVVAPAGPSDQTSMLSLGLEAGLGMRVPIRGRLSVTPGLRYDWMNTKFREGPLVRMRWLTADMGVALGF